MGGPRYAHSCLGFLDTSSSFSLQWHRAWATSDSVIVAVAILDTDQFEDEHKQPPRVFVLRQAIGLHVLNDASLSVSTNSVIAFFDYDSSGVKRAASVLLTREDTATGRAFVAHVRERAGLSTKSDKEP